MSRLVTPPARQISGTSHFGSALACRPMFMPNHTIPSDPPRDARGGPASRSARGAAYRSRCGCGSVIATGAGSRERCRRIRAAAICTAVRPSSSAVARTKSSGSSASVGMPSCNSRSPSSARMASAVGGPLQVALTPAAAINCSARRWRGAGTINMQTPLRPARPVRPLRCSRVSRSAGRSAWITSPRSGRSSPRAATLVATHTRACPSRNACNARVRSFWVSSPDSATAVKPRSSRLACKCRTPSRVAQNTRAVGASKKRNTLTTACAASPGATRTARYSMSACAWLRTSVSIRTASRW